jgi:hypothetical protein
VGVGNRQPATRHRSDGAVVHRLVHRANQHVPDQPFRTLRTASGREQSLWPSDARAKLSHPCVLWGWCDIPFILVSSSRSGRPRA